MPSSYFPTKNKTRTITFILIAITVLWMLSGLFISHMPEEEMQTDAAATARHITYGVQSFTAMQKRRTALVQGETKAMRDVNLVAQTQGKVVALLAEEGQKVAAGQPIVQLDMQDRKERLVALEALVAQHTQEYDVAQKLAKRGFESEVRVKRAKASLASAQANLKQMRLEVGFTTIKAPFDGFLEKINVKVGDFAGVGVFGVEGAIARVVDIDPLLVTGSVSQADRPFVAEKEMVEVVLQNGQVVQGRIHYLAHAADATSRAFPIEVAVDNPDASLLAGLSATLHVPLDALSAHQIPASSLSLQDDGGVQVKALDTQGKVVAYRVTLMEAVNVAEAKGGVWVQGLPEQVKVIVQGHPYAAAGEVIAPEKIKEVEAKE
jgi:multidrug efflux system membrane fusion protein